VVSKGMPEQAERDLLSPSTSYTEYLDESGKPIKVWAANDIMSLGQFHRPLSPCPWNKPSPATLHA
jgi:hypothetical protein